MQIPSQLLGGERSGAFPVAHPCRSGGCSASVTPALGCILPSLGAEPAHGHPQARLTGAAAYCRHGSTLSPWLC